MDVKKRIKKMHTYKRTKEKNQSNGDKINRKQKRRNKTYKTDVRNRCSICTYHRQINCLRRNKKQYRKSLWFALYKQVNIFP